MRTDLTFEIPPGRIASSISSTGASRTASHASKRSRRRRKATSRLRSLVDCERTVSTSSPIGSPWGSITGIPYIARRRSRTARTRLARGRRQGVGTRRSIVPAPMAPVTEHLDTLHDQPLFWRSAEGGEPPVLYLHGVPTSSDDWLAFLRAHGRAGPRPARLRAQRQARRRRLHDARLRPLRRGLPRPRRGRARAAGRARLGRGGPAVGPALPRARRAPGRDQRRPAAARLSLAPRSPALWRLRASARWSSGSPRGGPGGGCSRPRWPRSPGRTSTRAPSARSCSSTARARRTRSRARASTSGASTARRSSCGAIATPTSRRRFADAYAGGARRRRRGPAPP